MPEAASMFVMGSFVAACTVKVPRFPEPGESLAAEAFTLEAGGKGLNLAVGSRRLGATVDGLIAVGSDPLAALAEAALAEAGLPLGMLRRFPGPSGAGTGFTDGNGENCLAVHAGANARLSPEDVQAVAPRLRRARLVLAQFEIGDPAIAAAFAAAREGGAVTILNPSPFRRLDEAILRNTRILVVNRVEAARLERDLGLARSPPGDAETLRPLAEAMAARGVETLVVTMGDSGAVAFHPPGRVTRQPAFPVAPVDTLGAGDAFTAAFAAAMLERLPFETCMRRGAAAGALATTRLGVLNALPTREALAAVLGE